MTTYARIQSPVALRFWVWGTTETSKHSQPLEQTGQVRFLRATASSAIPDPKPEPFELPEMLRLACVA